MLARLGLPACVLVLAIVALTLLPDQEAGWSHAGSVSRSGRSLTGYFGSSTTRYLLEPTGWDSLSKAMGRAFEARVDEPFEIRVRVARQIARE